VPTRRLNEQVRRNADRFPEDFFFPLTAEEFAALQAQGTVTADGRVALRSQIATLKRGQHAKYLPHAFTEHGAIMAATVLNSPEAVAMSVFVVRAFMQMREQLAANAAILKRLAEIDKTLLAHDQSLRVIWQKLQPLLLPPAEPPKTHHRLPRPRTPRQIQNPLGSPEPNSNCLPPFYLIAAFSGSNTPFAACQLRRKLPRCSPKTDFHSHGDMTISRRWDI